MKNYIAIACVAISLTACATGPVASLEYKSYENPKGGIIYTYRNNDFSGQRYGESVAAFEKRRKEPDGPDAPKTLMREFCAPEPYRVVAEGKISSTSGASSQQIGAFTLTNVNVDKQPYLRFECGNRKPASK